MTELPIQDSLVEGSYMLSESKQFNLWKVSVWPDELQIIQQVIIEQFG